MAKKKKAGHAGRAHAKLGPSGAAGYLRCPGKPRAEEGHEDVTGFFAAEGTVFHEWAADCLEFDLEPEDLYGSRIRVNTGWATDEEGNPILIDGTVRPPKDPILVALGEEDDEDEAPQAQTFYEFVMDAEFGRHMRRGLNRVRELATNALLFVERRVDISRWTIPGQFGTSDVTIVDLKNLEITLFDWKYGAGVPVSPVENEQLFLYLLGSWNDIAEELFEGIDPADIKVRLIIEQPRAPGGGGEWETTMARALEWGEWCRERAELTQDPLAERVAGEKQCTFCKARGDCGTLSKYLLDMARLRFDELDDAMEHDYAPPMRQAHDLTPAERAFIHRNASLFRNWLDTIHASLMKDFLNGEETPGVKMVMGNRGKRVYIADKAAEAEDFLVEALGTKEAYVRKPLTPAQAEKKLSEEDYAKLSEFVRQADGKPTLVSENDARPPIPKLEDRFDDLTDEED